MGGSGDLSNGVVDVAAERVAAFVAVEERWKDPQRQRRRDEERIAPQRFEDQIA